jgi:hypothetical protein
MRVIFPCRSFLRIQSLVQQLFKEMPWRVLGGSVAEHGVGGLAVFFRIRAAGEDPRGTFRAAGERGVAKARGNERGLRGMRRAGGFHVDVQLVLTTAGERMLPPIGRKKG